MQAVGGRLMTRPSRWVVIGTSPIVDTAVTIGPLRRGQTEEAVKELERRGYVTEVCELFTIAEAFNDPEFLA